MSSLVQTFNVGAVQAGHYQRVDVTLTWDSQMPMEFRLHFPDLNGSEKPWHVSRDLLVRVSSDEGDAAFGVIGMGDVTAMRARVERWSPDRTASLGFFDWVQLRLESPEGRIAVSFKTPALAAFVRSSLAMCPPESEAVDVDGLIHQIFKSAEEAS